MKSINQSISPLTEGFNFFVNLFANGQFNELSVVPSVDGYRVSLDNENYLGTLAKNADSTWNVVEGCFPSTLLQDITNRIDKRIGNL